LLDTYEHLEPAFWTKLGKTSWFHRPVCSTPCKC